MKALKTSILTTALLAALGLGSAAQANIVDLFTDPADFTTNKVQDETVGGGSCVLGTVVGNGCFQEYGPGSNILGDYRDLYVEAIAQTSGAPTTKMYAGGGVLSFNNDSGTTGYGKVQWDGKDSSANLAHDKMDVNLVNQTGCGVDGCTKFVAQVLTADQGFEYKITLIDTANNSATLTADTLFPVSVAYNSEYFFEWFNLAPGSYFLDGLPFSIACGTFGGNCGTIDFTHIGAVQFELNTDQEHPAIIAVDLQLASITKETPEPSALALAGLALVGLGAATRRRKALSKA